MMSSGRQMALGLSVYKLGYHRGAWRMPGFPEDAFMNLRPYAEAARVAEQAKLDFVFFADIMGVENFENPNREMAYEHFAVKLDPIVVLSALAALTRNIGLIGTISTTYAHPYRIARTMASLDVISGGRAGWNVVTSYSPDEMRNYGLETRPDHDTRYDRAFEAIEVVSGLWASWQDGAFVRDKASGVYVDRNKINVLSHKGRHFSSKGPLDVAPSPQGAPVIVTAGDSPAASEMAARFAAIQYAATDGDIGKARFAYQATKSRVVELGRHPDELWILPGLMPIVGETEREAIAKRDQIRKLVHPRNGLGMLEPLFGDLSECDLDGPLPRSVAPPPDRLGGTAKALFDRAIAEGFTIRQTYEDYSVGEWWFMTRVGTPKTIADEMEEWFATGAADGFNILPHCMPDGVDDFAALIVPELQRRGLFKREYRGSTLRELLGLAHPGRGRH
ncbi:MAG: LLM class flavin-dependent oxidoreductase [Hyphomicrobiaceae bacterium]